MNRPVTSKAPAKSFTPVSLSTPSRANQPTAKATTIMASAMARKAKAAPSVGSAAPKDSMAAPAKSRMAAPAKAMLAAPVKAPVAAPAKASEAAPAKANVAAPAKAKVAAPAVAKLERAATSIPGKAISKTSTRAAPPTAKATASSMKASRPAAAATKSKAGVTLVKAKGSAPGLQRAATLGSLTPAPKSEDAAQAADVKNALSGALVSTTDEVAQGVDLTKALSAASVSITRDVAQGVDVKKALSAASVSITQDVAQGVDVKKALSAASVSFTQDVEQGADVKKTLSWASIKVVEDGQTETTRLMEAGGNAVAEVQVRAEGGEEERRAEINGKKQGEREEVEVEGMRLMDKEDREAQKEELDEERARWVQEAEYLEKKVEFSHIVHAESENNNAVAEMQFPAGRISVAASDDASLPVFSPSFGSMVDDENAKLRVSAVHGEEINLDRLLATTQMLLELHSTVSSPGVSHPSTKASYRPGLHSFGSMNSAADLGNDEDKAAQILKQARILRDRESEITDRSEVSHMSGGTATFQDLRKSIAYLASLDELSGANPRASYGHHAHQRLSLRSGGFRGSNILSPIALVGRTGRKHSIGTLSLQEAVIQKLRDENQLVGEQVRQLEAEKIALEHARMAEEEKYNRLKSLTAESADEAYTQEASDGHWTTKKHSLSHPVLSTTSGLRAGGEAQTAAVESGRNQLPRGRPKRHTFSAVTFAEETFARSQLGSRTKSLPVEVNDSLDRAGKKLEVFISREQSNEAKMVAAATAAAVRADEWEAKYRVLEREMEEQQIRQQNQPRVTWVPDILGPDAQDNSATDKVSDKQDTSQGDRENESTEAAPRRRSRVCTCVNAESCKSWFWLFYTAIGCCSCADAPDRCRCGARSELTFDNIPSEHVSPIAFRPAR